jgi:hypothetical protein
MAGGGILSLRDALKNKGRTLPLPQGEAGGDRGVLLRQGDLRGQCDVERGTAEESPGGEKRDLVSRAGVVEGRPAREREVHRAADNRNAPD